MPNLTNITEIYEALKNLLTQHVQGVRVQPLTSEDYDQDTGKILAEPPAVMIVFRDERLEPETQSHLQYNSRQSFLLICGAKNLRSVDEERIGALDLLGRVTDVLAGARLAVSSNVLRALVIPRAVELVQLDIEGTWYQLTVEVVNAAQFSGAAAA